MERNDKTSELDVGNGNEQIKRGARPFVESMWALVGRCRTCFLLYRRSKMEVSFCTVYWRGIRFAVTCVSWLDVINSVLMQTRNGSLPTLPTAAPCLGADSKKWKKSCGEDAQNDTTHPLQSSSIDIPIFVSALEDGTLTRPGLRRKLPVAPPDDAPSAVPTFPKDPRRTHLDATSAFDMWATTSAASGSDTGSDNGVPRNTKEVYVHEVCSLE